MLVLIKPRSTLCVSTTTRHMREEDEWKTVLMQPHPHLLCFFLPQLSRNYLCNNTLYLFPIIPCARLSANSLRSAFSAKSLRSTFWRLAALVFLATRCARLSAKLAALVFISTCCARLSANSLRSAFLIALGFSADSLRSTFG